MTSAAFTENAPVTRAIAAPPPPGPRQQHHSALLPESVQLYRVVDFAYTGRDCVAMCATNYSLESSPSKPSQPSKPPNLSSVTVAFRQPAVGQRALGLCGPLVDARDVRRGSVIHVCGGEHSLKGRMQPAVRERRVQASHLSGPIMDRQNACGGALWDTRGELHG